ncbi:proteoglycan 4-like [Hyalella azteca]|uniref:Proteoglycan 4-like n=1 Tax=Hyalella azteca TaxID=294128 RepID=A0A8B7PFY4_HYAAZ|nr:proteoglycan 4-like [Hyalella azteca]
MYLSSTLTPPPPESQPVKPTTTRITSPKFKHFLSLPPKPNTILTPPRKSEQSLTPPPDTTLTPPPDTTFTPPPKFKPALTQPPKPKTTLTPPLNSEQQVTQPPDTTLTPPPEQEPSFTQPPEPNTTLTPPPKFEQFISLPPKHHPPKPNTTLTPPPKPKVNTDQKLEKATHNELIDNKHGKTISKNDIYENINAKNKNFNDKTQITHKKSDVTEDKVLKTTANDNNSSASKNKEGFTNEQWNYREIPTERSLSLPRYGGLSLLLILDGEYHPEKPRQDNAALNTS